jgi:MerR family transcriptional regulator, thiopeptide resistance regulator
LLRATAEENAMKFEAVKVGELAKRTGLTVRTLHHYDEIGLLTPSLHTDSGHRLYTGGDVVRLQQVLSLRQLGFSLEEVRACLDRPEFSPLEVIVLQAARLREQIALESKLCDRLDVIAAHLRAAGDVSAEEFLQIIEEMTMIESNYTPEQLEQLRIRKEQVGEERIQQVQQEWPELIAQVRAAMEKGTDPTAPEVLALAKRWMGLVNEFTGGDPGIERSAKRLWTEKGDDLITKHGPEYDFRGAYEYIGRAMEALKSKD